MDYYENLGNLHKEYQLPDIIKYIPQLLKSKHVI